MSHDHSRHGSCSLRLIIRVLHLIIHSLAGAVTAVVVCSGALLGERTYESISTMKSVSSVEVESTPVLFAEGAPANSEPAKVPSRASETSEPNFTRPSRCRCHALERERISSDVRIVN